jgi:hypothetical protein
LKDTSRATERPRIISVMPVLRVCRLSWIAASASAPSDAATRRPMTPPEVTTSTTADGSRSAQISLAAAVTRSPNARHDSVPAGASACFDHPCNAARTAVK